MMHKALRKYCIISVRHIWVIYLFSVGQNKFGSSAGFLNVHSCKEQISTKTQSLEKHFRWLFQKN